MRTIRLDNSDSASTLLAIDVRRTVWFCDRVPQNPEAIMVPVDADGLKSLIADRLKYGKCADEVAKLIQKAAAVADKFGGKDQVKSTDILTLFEEIRRQPQGGILFNRQDVPNHPEIKPVGRRWLGLGKLYSRKRYDQCFLARVFSRSTQW